MIDIHEIGKILEANDENHLRVFDMGKNPLLKINGSDAQDCFNQLQQHFKTLSGYKRLIIKTGTDKNVSNNFAGANSYNVFFPESSVTSTQSPVNAPSSLGMSKELFDTKLELELMKKEKLFDDRLRKLEEKKHDDSEHLLPIIAVGGKLLGWKKDDIKEMIEMFFMGKNMQLGRSPEQKTKLSVEGTTEEEQQKVKVKELARLMKIVVNHSEDGIDKLIILLRAIEKNPSLIDTAISLLNNIN